jgi:signal recognition particle subunit SRP54
LRRLAERAGVECFDPGGEVAGDDPVAICRAAVAAARSGPARVLIVDTAGRLHLDDELMQELREIHRIVAPDEILFVADAMTGQDAVRSSQAFGEAIGLTGVVLSKLDGDARGGAALSVVSVTGVPIKFFGVGERNEDLETFSPERMASRILGMGDLQGLLERVENSLTGDADGKEGEHDEDDGTADPGEMDLEQVRTQIRRLRRAGPLNRLLEMLPGGSKLGDLSDSNDQMRETLAILDSMTPKERRRPEIMNGSRRRRVARGSGVKVETVNRFLKQFAQVRKMMSRMPGGNLPGGWEQALKGLR